MKASQKWLQSVLEKWNLNSQALDTLDQYTLNAQNYLTQNILPQMQEMLKNISAGVFDLINFLKNFLIGAIVSLYLMADKEELYRQGEHAHICSIFSAAREFYHPFHALYQ